MRQPARSRTVNRAAAPFVFLTLEDETGLVNITVRPDLIESHGHVVVTSDVLEVDGVLLNKTGPGRVAARRATPRSWKDNTDVFGT